MSLRSYYERLEACFEGGCGGCYEVWPLWLVSIHSGFALYDANAILCVVSVPLSITLLCSLAQ